MHVLDEGVDGGDQVAEHGAVVADAHVHARAPAAHDLGDAPDQLELGLRHRPRERTGRRAAPCYIGRAMNASSLARLTFAFTPPGG